MGANYGQMIELIVSGKMANTVFTRQIVVDHEMALEENKDKSGKDYAEWLAWQSRKKEMQQEGRWPF